MPPCQVPNPAQPVWIGCPVVSVNSAPAGRSPADALEAGSSRDSPPGFTTSEPLLESRLVSAILPILFLARGWMCDMAQMVSRATVISDGCHLYYTSLVLSLHPITIVGPFKPIVRVHTVASMNWCCFRLESSKLSPTVIMLFVGEMPC